MTSRRPEALAGLAQAHPERLQSLALDVTSPSGARDVVAAVVERFGGLDVVVNNAGYATNGTVEDFPEDEFRAQVEANLFGVVNVTRAALPVLRGRLFGTLRADLVRRGPRRRHAGPQRLPDRQVRRRGLLGGPGERGVPARHQGDHRGAGRHPHRLGHAAPR